MKRLLGLSRQGERGFTLLEILVVVAILGILAAIVIPSIMGLMNEGREEAMQEEFHSVRTAVLAMMVRAHGSDLDGDYTDIDELTEVHGVTVTDTTANPNVTYYLDDYLMGGKYPLMQAYDITQEDGTVTVAD